MAIRFFGNDLDTLRQIALQAERMLRETPGAIYVRNDVGLLKSDMRLRINTEKSRSLGIQTADIDKTVRLAVAGFPLGTYTNDKGDDHDIVADAPRGASPTLKTFEGLFINNALGTPVPLSQISTLEFESTPSTIKHMDKKRYVLVTAFNRQGVLSEKVLADFLDKVKALKLPAGYSFQVAGDVESKQQAFGGGFGTVIIATVFLFIMVLLLEFKTFKSTLIVLSVIPLGIIGGVAMLWITGNPMSFVAIVGFIALAGVEVKNSILLVDFTNQLREEGRSLDDAVREAGEIQIGRASCRERV